MSSHAERGMQQILAERSRNVLMGRIWRGRTKAEIANQYTEYLYREGVLSVETKPGCLGMQMFRSVKEDLAEFTTISYWESVDAMKAQYSDHGDPMRASHLERDEEFLLELPEYIELTDLIANDWKAGNA